MVIKMLSIVGKTQGKISRQVGCSQLTVSKCLQDKSPGYKKYGYKHVIIKWDNWKLAKLVCLDQFQKYREIAQQWNTDDIPACITYCRVKTISYANCIVQVKPLLNFKQYKKWLTWATKKQYWTVGQWSQVIFSDKSIFLYLFGN